jgi:hypothetical protein
LVTYQNCKKHRQKNIKNLANIIDRL